jgi:hypothetical protein
LTPAQVSRFFQSVDNRGGPDVCHMWTTATDQDGYGEFFIRGKANRAHRLSWALLNGPIPNGMCICHTCDNPPCVNPKHLFLGTNLDNIADKVAKGRQAKGDAQGLRKHPELAAWGDRNGSRTRPECLARGTRNGAFTKPERRPAGSRHGRHTKPERNAKGETHGRAKLTAAQVYEIRKRTSEGGSFAGIGREFAVAAETIGKIHKRQIWKSLPPDTGSDAQ